MFDYKEMAHTLMEAERSIVRKICNWEPMGVNGVVPAASQGLRTRRGDSVSSSLSARGQSCPSSRSERE